MRVFLTVLLVLALIGVLGVLGAGVVTIVRGGNPQRSNKLMQARVVMQAIALLLLAMLMMLASR
ncbi:MAG TPA: twin transmembrane helix small protein [Stellaceae bacterium]|nr:twin transmembrane helix small protein [Stellaceae bacterium]